MPILNSDLVRLSVGAILLIVGMVLFNIGVNTSIITIGDLIGSTLTKVKRLILVIGFLVTAEPSLEFSKTDQ